MRPVRAAFTGAAACALVLATLGPLGAATVEGVSFPDSATLGGKECRLNGVGVRKKLFIKVYLGALYLATPTADAAAAVAADEPKRVVLHFLHSKVGADAMREAWRDGFIAQVPVAPADLQQRFERFVGLFGEDRKRGDVVTITYVPGQGTEVQINDVRKDLIGGADFMRALWGIWLGAKPADEGLKKGMLGSAR